VSDGRALCRESSLEPVPGWRQGHGLWLCPEPGESVSLRCPAGRPDATGGPYCAAHGGRERAQQEAERDWNWLAPECVGDAAAVLAAGTLQLTTEHAYVVVRPRSEHGIWLAWLGLGSHLEPVPRTAYDGCGRPGCRSCREGQGCGRRRHAFPSRALAAADAITLWRRRLRARIEEISAARGDTLSWGMPVTPLADPLVLELGDHGSAWDEAMVRERIGSEGLAAITGLRSTGEAY
jgi:hypothetical protein